MSPQAVSKNPCPISVSRTQLRSVPVGDRDSLRRPLEEANLVRRRVDEHHLTSCAVRLDTGVQERTALRLEFGVQRFDVVDLNEHGTAGCTVAVVRGQVEHERARDTCRYTGDPPLLRTKVFGQSSVGVSDTSFKASQDRLRSRFVGDGPVSRAPMCSSVCPTRSIDVTRGRTASCCPWFHLLQARGHPDKH